MEKNPEFLIEYGISEGSFYNHKDKGFDYLVQSTVIKSSETKVMKASSRIIPSEFQNRKRWIR